MFRANERPLPLGLQASYCDGRYTLRSRELHVAPWLLVRDLILSPLYPFHPNQPFHLQRWKVEHLHCVVQERGLNHRIAQCLDPAPLTPFGRLQHFGLAFHPSHIECLTAFDAPRTWFSAQLLPIPGDSNAHPTTLSWAIHLPMAWGQAMPTPGRAVRAALTAILQQPSIATLFGTPLQPPLPATPNLQQGQLTLQPLRTLLIELLAPLGLRAPALPLMPTSISIDAEGLHLISSSDDQHVPQRPSAPSLLRWDRAQSSLDPNLLWPAHQEAPGSILLASLQQALHRLGPEPMLVNEALHLHIAATAWEEAAALLHSAAENPANHTWLSLWETSVHLARRDLERATESLLGHGTTAEHPPSLPKIAATLALLHAGAPSREVAHYLRRHHEVPGATAPILQGLRHHLQSSGDPMALLEIMRLQAAIFQPAPQRRETYVTMAQVLATVFDGQDEARHLLQRAEALGVQTLEQARPLAVAYNAAGDPDGALRILAALATRFQAQQDHERAAECHFIGAEILQVYPDSRRLALLCCEEALTCDPHHLGAQRLRARLAFADGRVAPACIYYEEILRDLQGRLDQTDGPQARRTLKDSLGEVLSELAQSYSAANQVQQAIATWRRALRLDPNHPQAFEALFRTHHEAQDPASSLALCEQLWDDSALSQGRRLQCALEIARLHATQLSQPEQSLLWLDRAIQLAPENLEAYAQKYRILQRSGRMDELRAFLPVYIERCPETAQRVALLTHLARLHREHQHEPAQALQYLRQALALAPKDKQLLLETRAVLRQQGRLRELSQVLERLAALSDDGATKRAFQQEAADLHKTLANAPEKNFAFRDHQRYDPPQRPAPGARKEESLSATAARPQPHPPAASYLQPFPPYPRRDTEADILAEPISEELEVRLMPAPGRVGIHLVAAESDSTSGLDGVPEESFPLPRPKASPTEENESPPPAPEQSTGETSSMYFEKSPVAPASEVAKADEDAWLALADVVGTSAAPNANAPAVSPPLAELASPSALQSDLDPTAPAPAFRLPSPATAPDWRFAAQSWLQEQRSTRTDTPIAPAPPLSSSELSVLLQDARTQGDLASLMQLLRRAIDEAPTPMAKARFLQELGCLHYYDGDDGEAARTCLEEARLLDPHGVGVENESLTALEGIYEEEGDFESLSELYHIRLAHADNAETRNLYRLLLAQLDAEHLSRHREAMGHLDALLADEPDNEPALRLVAQLHIAAGRDREAAQALHRLAHTLPPNSSERHTLLRRMAELWTNVEAFAEAQQAMQQAVAISHDPLTDMEILKNICRRADDWDGLFSTLLAELSLITGRELTRERLELLDDVEALTTSAELGTTIAHALREAADVLARKIEAPLAAWNLYTLLIRLHPDQPYAREQRLELSRQLARWDSAVEDLEAMLHGPMDASQRFAALVEVAQIHAREHHDPHRAQQALERAFELALRLPEPPEALPHAHALLAELRPQEPHPRQAAPQPTASTAPHAQDTPSPHQPSRIASLIAQADIAMGANNPFVAQLNLRAAVALAPEALDARAKLVEALLAYGDHSNAVNHLSLLTSSTAATAAQLGHWRRLGEELARQAPPHLAQRAQRLIHDLPPATPEDP